MQTKTTTLSICRPVGLAAGKKILGVCARANAAVCLSYISENRYYLFFSSLQSFWPSEGRVRQIERFYAEKPDFSLLAASWASS